MHELIGFSCELIPSWMVSKGFLPDAIKELKEIREKEQKGEL